MHCAKCGRDNREGRKFCTSCGTPLVAACPNCGAPIQPDERFCGECGTAIGASVPRATSSAQPRPLQLSDAIPATEVIDGERKTVTALFADIKGSTELMRELDPEEARAVIDPVLQLVMDAVHRYDGYVVQSAGDGIFALFGAPVAHEDHPQRAVHAAIAMRDVLHRRDMDRSSRPAAEVRIGINTGEVVLRLVHTGGHTEYTPVGHAANLAARMQSAAPTGGIVISEDTRHLVEGYFELRELGPTEVKGVAQPINIYEVIGAGPLHGHFDLSVRRGLTKFVGREGELKQMAHALELARGGHGQMVAVVAEAGTGKSRLFYEFKATLPADCKVLEAYSVSHGKASAWLPVLALLHDYFGIQEANDPATRREKLRAALAILDPALADTQPYLFALLAIAESPDPLAQMDAQVKRRRIMEALKRIVLRESLKQPLAIIFEDLHWIDDQTQALLDLLADGIANARILLLVNYRPEYRHEWGNKSYYAQLRLDPLGRENTAEMLTTLLGDSVELNPLKRLIVERTEGNPFFIEEMVQALFDQGALVRNGEVRVVRSLSQVRLPPTVQGILASRIDRLAVEQKDLLQTMAVIGRESSGALIRKIAAPGDSGLEQMLSVLQAGEFIYEQPAAAEIEYVFKHALTQEVAYNSVLIERRKLLHERAGAAIEALYAEQLDDHLSELARHYQRSAKTEKALEYLGRAGQQAVQRSSQAEAIGLFTSALELLQTLPETFPRLEQELTLQLSLGPALWIVKGWAVPEASQAFARAHELCRQIGETPQLSQALHGLASYYLVVGKLETALELFRQILSIADPALLPSVHHNVGQIFFWMGQLMPAQTHLELSLSLYDPGHTGPFIECDLAVRDLCFLGWHSWFLGFPDQALDKSQHTLSLARQLSHPYTLAFAANGYAFISNLRGTGELALESATEGIQLATEHGFPHLLAGLIFNRGEALALRGQPEEGIAEMRKGIDSWRACGFGTMLTVLTAPLVRAYGMCGQVDKAFAALAEATALVENIGERLYEAELYRLKGELTLKGPDGTNSQVEEAEKYFRQAIEVARRQSAKSWELRATTSLARLLAEQGRRREACSMLAEIYNWFTEGFDTADLKDAKALLDELVN
jgi:class 3 adenylate cyclase/tetratricopeptide (TPR) repeat protein